MWLQDEPTSHLDMQSIECLQTCLQGYSGGLVLVTHDQHFCDCVADKVLTRFLGTLYMRIVFPSPMQTACLVSVAFAHSHKVPATVTYKSYAWEVCV